MGVCFAWKERWPKVQIYTDSQIEAYDLARHLSGGISSLAPSIWDFIHTNQFSGTSFVPNLLFHSDTFPGGSTKSSDARGKPWATCILANWLEIGGSQNPS